MVTISKNKLGINGYIIKSDEKPFFKYLLCMTLIFQIVKCQY